MESINEEERQPLLAAPEPGPEPCFPCRYMLAFLIFLGTFCVQGMRATFNIALVSMVNFTSNSNMSNNSECAVHIQPNHSSIKDGGEFNWDNSVQDTLLAAFFYGYITTQLLGGILADKVGAKFTVGIPIFSLAVLTLFVPLVARKDVNILIGLRVVQGVLCGPLYPSIGAMWGRWAPPQEKTKLLTWSTYGGNLGMVVGEISAGALCQSTFMGGWPSSLYVIGSVGILWSILWFSLAYDVPHKHPRISKAELLYIEASTGGVDMIQFKFPPMGKLLTSRPVWATMIVCVTDGIFFYMIINCGPLYMKEILNFDIAENGFLSPLPFLMLWITSCLVGPLADWLSKHLSITATRNIFTIIGEFGSAASLLGVAIVGCNHTSAVILLCLAGFLGGFSSAGFTLAAIDNAPMYAGTLTGIYNGVNQIGGFLAPQIQGLVTHGEPSRSKWQTFFYITAGISFAGALLFVLLFSGEELDWATETRIKQRKKAEGKDEAISGSTSVNR